MSLRDLLERERRRVTWLSAAAVATVLTGTVAVLVALSALLLAGARWLVLPRPVPYLLWLVIGLVLATGVRFARRRLARDGSVGGVARAVEHERTLRDGALRGALEVADSGALGRLNAERMADRLSSLSGGALAPRMRQRMRRRVMAGSAAAVAGAVMLVAGATTATDGWAALVHPLRAWRGTLLDGVRLDRVPRAVLRGERVSFEVRAPGRREVSVAYRITGASWRESHFPVRDGSATVRLDPVDADVALFATDGRAVSDTAVVRVVERPFVGDVTIRAQFPAYLDRREETIPLGEPARVPQGTVLSFDGQSSTELRDVRLVNGRDTVAMRAETRHFSGRMSAAASGRYEWHAVGAGGPIADVPPPLDLEVLPDSAPRVEILAPSGDTTVMAGDTVTVSVLATDDHGIHSIDLRSWIVTARGAVRPWSGRSVDVANQPQWAGETALITSALTPGDAMHVVVSAFDGSPWHLKGESRELVLRLPTLSEQREAARAAGDSTVERAAATAAAEKQLQQRTSDASRRRDRETSSATNARGQSAMSYQASEEAKAYAKEQRDLTNRVQQLQRAAQQLEQQLRQAGALDSGLQARLREAQQLLNEALTPELAEQLKKLEQASQKLSAEDARKALADLAQQQQRLREQLEKSVEMLKRAALEGSMATLKDDANDLAKRERQLADSLARADAQQRQGDAQSEAKKLADRSRDLADEVKSLQQRLQQQNAQSGAERAAEAQRRAQESAQALDRAAQQSATQRPNDVPQRPQQNGQQQSGQQQNGQQQNGQQQSGQQQSGQQQSGKQQSGQQQSGQQQSGQQQSGQQQSGQQQSGQQQSGQQQGAQSGNSSQAGQRPGQQSGADKGGDKQSSEGAARQAAQAMEEAANQLAKAREQQVSEWKQELTTELDRSIQEMIELARTQDALEQKARQGATPQDLRAEQGTLQQGVDKSAQRLQDAAQKSSLLSQRSLRMVSDARKSVEEATRQTQASSDGSQVASAMRDASESLNQAAASLVRDRERAQNANSASGFAEMLQQLQQMAQQQSSLNSSVQDLLPRTGAQLDAKGQQMSRQLARDQREVAAKLDDVADQDATGRAEELAKEARQIAQALEAAQVDPNVVARQERLFRKMLDAGRLLEDDQREDTGKREAKAWTGTEVFTPQTSTAAGRSASRFQPPTWNDLRGLTPEERRLVLEYFKKINGERP